jgi:hypothetical protein
MGGKVFVSGVLMKCRRGRWVDKPFGRKYKDKKKLKSGYISYPVRESNLGVVLLGINRSVFDNSESGRGNVRK